MLVRRSAACRAGRVLLDGTHSNKFLNPIRDGAVLPILHLNGYKINNPTILSRVSYEELVHLFKGYGWSPLFVEGDEPAAMVKIVDVVREKEVAKVIAGLPLNMNGSRGQQADKTVAFVETLSLHLQIPVEYQDERLSTVSARELIQGVRKTSRDTRYDAAAAAVILQSYLDLCGRPKYKPIPTRIRPKTSSLGSCEGTTTNKITNTMPSP